MIQERSQAQPPSPPIAPPVVPPVAHPLLLITETSKHSPIEKLKKLGAEEFRGRSEDDSVKAEYWLQSLVGIFKQIACSLDDYLICAVSLLKKEVYNWWETVEVIVPKEKLTWEFFQNEFKKKYVGKRYLDKKKKEFLDLRQGNKSVAEYEREFVYLSKYARDIVPTEEKICIRFEERLNDEIRMMIGGNEIWEFIVLLNRAQKLEEVYNRKIQQDQKSKESFKRCAFKLFSDFPVKKSKEEISQTTSVPGRLGRGRSRQSNFRVFNRPAASVSSVQNTPRPKCQYCGRHHFGECMTKMGACYKCGATDHLIRDCLQLQKDEVEQKEIQRTTPQRSRRSGMRESVSQSENRALARTYIIRAREKAMAPDVIIGMDWLTKHDAVVNCREKRIDLKNQLPVVNEFADVFLEEFPSLPPYHEVEFVIDVISGTTPISITLYRMALTELKELKTQLQELLDKGFIRPSTSPWGAPM
ncbi:uncharacterized protein [Gossypium hirsutum]|uniref:CCHC-type domain-containing protein n=1 Tax=Gossypium hirsutum TaxID=3635 RepID=A0A1U8HUB0_GOSHI|nr:uncharacterized protein LOC107887829 [Gossypium hirsutum]